MGLCERGCGKLIGLLALAASWPAVGSAADASLAMVTDVQGTVVLATASKHPRLSLLQELPRGARLHLEAGASASVVFLDSGQEFQLSGPSDVELGASSPRALKGAAPRASSAAAPSAGPHVDPRKVNQAAIVMRGFDTPKRLLLLSPVGTTVLESAPEFRWHAADESASFRFELLDAGGKRVYSSAARGGELQLPASVALAPGARYTWLLTSEGSTGTPYSKAGDFIVASAELRTQAAKFRPSEDASVSSRVLYAAWLEQNGLRESARPYWQKISQERKDDARVKELAAEQP